MENQQNINQNNMVSSFGESMPAEFVDETLNVIKKLSLKVTAPVLFNFCANMLSNNGKDFITKHDVFTFLVQCANLNLNPMVKQIYGFVSRGKLAIVISIDGWNTIANRSPQFDGMDFEFGPVRERELNFVKTSYSNGQRSKVTTNVKRTVADWIKCIVYRKDRTHPVCVTTFFDEAYTGSEPWANQPMQMLQNRAFVNSIKKAFNISAYAEDDNIMTMDVTIPEDIEPVINDNNVPQQIQSAPVAQIEQQQQSDLMNQIQSQTTNVEIPELQQTPVKRTRKRKTVTAVEQPVEQPVTVPEPAEIPPDIPANFEETGIDQSVATQDIQCDFPPTPEMPPLPPLNQAAEPEQNIPTPTSDIGKELAAIIERAQNVTALQFFGMNIAQMTQLPQNDKDALNYLYDKKMNELKNK